MIKKLAVLLMLAFAFPVFAQQQTNVTWADLQKNIDSWLDGPTGLLVTPQERDVFKRLKSPEEKMQFIKIFWQRRDPILRTRENEFKDEFYKRVDYANKNFEETGTPGWKTARGQTHILFGPPGRIDTQSVEGSSRPAQLWVYDKRPSKELPPNESLMFVYRDFKYVLAPPNAQPGDTIGEEQRKIDAGFRYQNIPSQVARAFVDVRNTDVIDDSKNYDSLLYSVKSTEKFQITEIPFDARINDHNQPEIILKKEDAPIYDAGDRMFGELYIKQELKQGDKVVASNDFSSSYSWSYGEFANLQNIIVPLKNLEAPAGKYDLTVTVQDRISMVSESKTIPVTY